MWILKRDRDKLPTFCHDKYETNGQINIRNAFLWICKTNYDSTNEKQQVKINMRKKKNENFAFNLKLIKLKRCIITNDST